MHFRGWAWQVVQPARGEHAARGIGRASRRGTHTVTKGACVAADVVLEGEGIWPPTGGPELQKGEP
jgi:hypothetical protein